MFFSENEPLIVLQTTMDSYTHRLMPETEPFLVFITLSNVTGADTLDKQINKSSLLGLYLFFKALLILSKFTQNSGTLTYLD